MTWCWQSSVIFAAGKGRTSSEGRCRYPTLGAQELPSLTSTQDTNLYDKLRAHAGILNVPHLSPL